MKMRRNGNSLTRVIIIMLSFVPSSSQCRNAPAPRASETKDGANGTEKANRDRKRCQRGDQDTIRAIAAPAAAAARASRLGWYMVYMTALVAVVSQIDRGILASFVQPMKRDFHLSDTQMSILLGFAFTFFYVVGGPPSIHFACSSRLEGGPTQWCRPRSSTI